MDWRTTDTRYAVATVAALGVSAWLTLSSFGVGPSPLPRIADDPAPQLAGLTFDVGATAPDQEPDDEPGFSVQPPILDPPPRPDPTPRPDLDTTAPRSGFTTEDGAVLVGVPGPAMVSGTASDDRSGVAGVTVTFTGSGGNRQIAVATVECKSARRSCTWTVEAPSTGEWEVTVSASDLAGNTEPESAAIGITVVQASPLAAPLGEVTSTLATLVDVVTSLLGLG